MFFEYSGNIALWLLEFTKRSTFVIIKSYTFTTKAILTQKQFFHWEFFKKYFPLKCSLNVPWMPGTWQHLGNIQRIFLEYCLPAGKCVCLSTYLCTCRFACRNLRVETFYVHEINLANSRFVEFWFICSFSICLVTPISLLIVYIAMVE